MISDRIITALTNGIDNERRIFELLKECMLFQQLKMWRISKNQDRFETSILT